MKPVKVAQISATHDHALPTFRTMRRLKDVFEVVGFAESSTVGVAGNPVLNQEADYDQVPRYTVEELLEMPDLEAVAIECEEENATAIAQRFAEKGIAIHLDKPGSQNIESFEKLIATCREKNVPFHQGYMYRYNPSVQHLLQMIKNGELGEIYAVEAHMDCWHPIKKRQWLGKHKGGMMYFLGCHLIDMILQIQGEPEEIIPMNMATGLDGVTGEDYGFAVLKYKNGISFAKTCAAEVDGYLRRQLVVCGSKGTYVIQPWEKSAVKDPKDPDQRYYQVSPSRVALINDDMRNWSTDHSVPLEFEPADRYERMMRSFAEIIRGAENPYSYDYELKVFHAVMKASGYTGE